MEFEVEPEVADGIAMSGGYIGTKKREKDGFVEKEKLC